MDKIIDFLFSSDIAILKKIKSLTGTHSNILSSTYGSEFFVVIVIIISCTQIYPLIPILFPNNSNKNLLKAKKEVRAKINIKNR